MVSLYSGVDAAAVWSRLPQRYRTIVDIAALGAGPIDLLVFETGEEHVVTLEDLEKARRGIERSSMQLAVIGYDFTEEARTKISSLGRIHLRGAERIGMDRETLVHAIG